MRILLLGGTAEARELAEMLAIRGVDAVLSLAGVTDAPPSPLPHRKGGFGGEQGLIDYLQAAQITQLIDATHPFAAQMSRHASAASKATGIPLLRLTRPAWPLQPQWLQVSSIAEAAVALPKGARAFLALGAQSLAPFATRPDVWFLTRSIQPPATRLPGETILARPPFALADEIALMQAHKITHLVTKNAGGAQTIAKLHAATELGIQLVIITRPVLPPAAEVSSTHDALKALTL